ncbi:hypothetical protein FB565_000777 [Actinoplanes lutulentus]|uniref:Uncharacterized protein n=1 Tax=Actinoplanes lutulentus TaxID=1287878 RepID=A0A327ZKN8_9ACTN|nr:hypothetical protein [Actinoplanes lutulentus]MBB2941073.1 hypothetical protein [Actinoplanes lutulentus]RAK43382.1 hypothetical protein B0I29_101512 [Actinoplanes lutulentus]
MSESRVAKHTFVYNGERYFRDKSEDIVMCSYGEKEDPLGTKASLNVTDHVERALLKGRVHYVTTADVEWERQAKAEVEADGGLKYFTAAASGTASFSYERAKTAKLKLAKFVIDEGPLQELLNKDAGKARKFLAQEGGDGRIVSTIWVVVEAVIAESFAAAGKSTGAIEAEVLSATKMRLTVKKSGSASGSTTIIWEPGTTFAYLMHKVGKWNKGKTQVDELVIDAKGLN